MTDESLQALITRRESAIERIRRVLIDTARLRLEPDQIDPDAPLFGTGLALDSVDALELVVGVEQEFKVNLPQHRVHGGLRTVNSLVDLILVLQSERAAAGAAS